MYRRNNLLFTGYKLDAILEARARQITAKVNEIQKDQFLTTSEDDLVEYIFSQLYIEPLTLYEESAEQEQNEATVSISGRRGTVHVPGIRVVVSIPFTGDFDLWNLCPNKFQSTFPRADVREPIGDKPGNIEIVLQQPTDEQPEQLQKDLDDELKRIRFYIEAQRSQVEQYNKTAPDIIRRAIQSRRERLKKHDEIADFLKIPLKRRGGVPQVQPIPIKRKLVKPLPPPPKSGLKSEPGITDEDFEHILSVIRHEGRTFETTPKTYAVHDEEELRDIMLAHLNGHYEGGATGETFRKTGKTDIRIEDQSRAAFIAECKIWRGEKELAEAVDQLLAYLTWRDCKAAIVIFNKHNAKFTELLDKVPATLSAHQKFKKDLGQRGDGEWRFLFTSAEDELRQVIVNVFLFNIYVT